MRDLILTCGTDLLFVVVILMLDARDACRKDLTSLVPLEARDSFSWRKALQIVAPVRCVLARACIVLARAHLI